MDTDLHSPSPPPTPIDPVVQARLDRLAASRAATTPSTTSGTTSPNGRHRKRHAAKRSRAAAVLMSLTATAGLSAYFQHTDSVGASSTTNSVTGVAVAVATPPAAAAAPNASPSATAASTTPAAASTNTTSALADGTYAGATATNKYGPVQVQITVAGGKITDVVALQTPTGDRKSISINDRATPTLVSEALSAQSANVDTVSGATYTTDSYKISLQSAIDLAHATTVQSSATS